MLRAKKNCAGQEEPKLPLSSPSIPPSTRLSLCVQAGCSSLPWCFPSSLLQPWRPTPRGLVLPLLFLRRELLQPCSAREEALLSALASSPLGFGAASPSQSQNAHQKQKEEEEKQKQTKQKGRKFRKIRKLPPPPTQLGMYSGQEFAGRAQCGLGQCGLGFLRAEWCGLRAAG